MDAYLERARGALGDRSPAAVLLDRGPGPDEGPVLAGWWCEPDRHPGLVVLPNPYDDVGLVAEAEEGAWRLTQEVLRALGARLDELAGRPMPALHWELVLGPWLLFCASALVDRELYLRTAAALAPEAELLGGGRLEPPVTMASLYDTLWTDAGNRALMSALGRALGLAIRELPPPPAEPALTAPAAAGGGLAGAARAIALRATLGRGRGRRVVLTGNVHVRRADALRLARRVRGLRAAPLPAAASGWHDAVAARPDHPGREALAELPLQSERGRLLAGLLPALLPRSVLEGRCELEAESARLYGPAAHAVAGSAQADEVQNWFLARCAAAGRRICFAQHGGTYLQLRVNAQERLERRPGAEFLSWGGTGQGVRVLGSPHLAALRDTHRGGDAVVLVEHITPAVESYVERFTSSPLGNQGYELSAALAAFVEAAGPARPHLVLKRFTAFGGGEKRHPVLEGLPHEGPVDSTRAVDWMRAARLAVIGTPDTALIEAMAMNVPVVGLWDPRVWVMREDAAAPFEAFARAGVFFADANAAAAHVGEVYSSAYEWWASSEIQALRRAFLARFGRGGPEWRAEWSAFLSELASEPATER